MNIMLFEKIKNIDMQRYVSHLLIFAVGIGCVFSCCSLYYFYKVYQEQAAQKVIGFCIEDYRNALKSKDRDWDKIIDGFSLAATEFSASALAPYCYVFQAQVLYEKGDYSGSIKVLEKAVEMIPKGSLFFYVFKTKLALFMLDARDELDKQKGVAMLTDVARAPDNVVKDYALYYLGYYHWSRNELNEAKKIWQELVDEYRHEKSSPSTWAQLAEQKLPYIL